MRELGGGRGPLLAAALWLAAVPPGARAQRAEPLRKSDLIRLLTSGALSSSEIADLVRRDCLSFTPTARDRQDLQGLGADSAIMARIDACVRAAALPRLPPPPPLPSRPPAPPVGLRTAPSPVRTSPRPPRPLQARDTSARHVTQPAPTPHLAATPAAARTGFLSGTGQVGVVGQRAALPLVFEVRDSGGAPVADIAVALTATNGRLLASGAGGAGGAGRERTDSRGQLRAEVVFGERAAPTVVTAAVGVIVRQATLYPSPGPAARLIATYKGRAVDRHLVIDPDAPALLYVTAQDTFGNAVVSPLPDVVVAVADNGVLKVSRVIPDSLGAVVTLKPGRPGGGSTGLALQAGRVRLDLSASVRVRP